MRLVRQRNSAVHCDQQENLLDFFGGAAVAQRPFDVDAELVRATAPAIIATMTRDLVAIGSAGRLQTSP